MDIIEFILDKITLYNMTVTLLSAISNGFLTAVWENIKNSAKWQINKRKIKKNEVNFKTTTITSLEHGNPEISFSDIEMNDSGECFYLSSDFNKPDILFKDDSLRSVVDSIYKCFVIESERKDEDNWYEVLQQCRKTVIETENQEFFNKEIVGIRRIHFCRLGYEENPGFVLDYYKTNYFTDQVMSLFYKNLKQKHKQISLNKNNLNKLPYLLTSICVKPLIDIKKNRTLLIKDKNLSDDDLIWKIDSSVLNNFKTEMEKKAAVYFNIPGIEFEKIDLSDVFLLKDTVNFTITCIAYADKNSVVSDNNRLLKIRSGSIKQIYNDTDKYVEHISDRDYGSLIMFASKKGSGDVD